MNKIMVLFLLCSCTHLKKTSDEEILKFCQSLNVLYQRIEVISSNLANVNTTRTVDGGYYRKKIVKDCKNGFCEIVNDDTPPILKYEPHHPDADKNGYVSYPNINVNKEKADQLYWEQVYNLVWENSPVQKNFFLVDPRAKVCFEKYPYLKAKLDYSKYLGH